MIDGDLVCPECSQPMRSVGFVLSERDEGRRACRTLWGRSGRQVWWRWADQRDEPWEICPVPELFR